ncbi:tubulin-specific chaperone E [Ambystoma mexicanum]|uniref:tubulin-specific chaperone E n=1 Tax=Ambystoma mexicanum TaxID=8296 RepID=UPI0037E7B85F
MGDSVPCNAIGSRITCDGEYATVLYVGNVPPTTGLWLGVEWDKPQRGKHNGCHEGVQYFKCDNPLGGSFVRPKKANFGVDFVTALKSRYVFNSKLSENTKGDLIIGKKKVELIVLEFAEEESQLRKLNNISLRDCNVSNAGEREDISKVCPNIAALNLSHNLLSSWDAVSDIALQLKHLETLDLSANRLRIPSDTGSLSGAFMNLKVLSLSHARLTWPKVLLCAPMWPVLEELHLASNDITVLERPVGVLQTLTLLDLSNNKLVDGNQLAELANLPVLEKLTVINTGISSLCFDDVGFGSKSTMFSTLKYLSIDKNNISQWLFINELDKLKCLQSLSCQNNPLLENESNLETARQLIIAKIADLKFLNKTEILPEERKGAELDYRKMFGNAWVTAGGNRDPELNRPSQAFLVEHPRYPYLIQKYGALEDGELKQQQPFALKNQLLTLNIRCPEQPERKPLVKKLPDSMTIQKVKGLLCRLLKVPGSELRLSYESTKMEGVEIELENDLKPLQFYCVESGDYILVRW